MVSIRLKVGPKGQIVIPKVFREAYGIKEGGEVIVEPTEEGLVIKKPPSKEELLRKLKEYHEKRKGTKPAKLGELKGISLEDEFDEVWGIEEWSSFYTRPLVLDETIHVAKKKYSVPYELSIEFIDEKVLPYVEILPLTVFDYLTARLIITKYNPHPSDALHVAVIENNGLQAIVSEDEDFDVLPLKRVWLGGWDGVYRAKFGEPELGWVVLVHGLGEHSGRYGRLIRELNEAGFAVYAFDWPGHGKSPGKRGHTSVEEAMEIIDSIIEELGEKPFLFGHSLGGLTVIRYIETRPDRIREW